MATPHGQSSLAQANERNIRGCRGTPRAATRARGIAASDTQELHAMSKQMKYGPNGYEPIEPEPPDHLGDKVGYKSPPKHTRWKKGQSGNPKGRKKRRIVNDLRTLFDEILAEEIKTREGGR